MRAPLWLTGDRTGRVTLAECRNCGKPKVLSRPCGLDHLAAVLEFNAARSEADQGGAS